MTRRLTGWIRWPADPGERVRRTCDLAAAAILIATLVFRLASFTQARFAGDEAFLYQTAKKTAALKTFPVYGVNVTGADVLTPGGTYHLLMSLPLFVSDEPEGPMVLTEILGVLALALGYRLFRREYGALAGVGTLALAAFNPFSVFFSDRHWNPNVLIPLGFLWLWLLLRSLRGEGRNSWAWLAVALVISPQFHLGCSHLTFLTAAMVAVIRPRNLPWKRIAVGTAAGLATYLPYFGYEAFHGFENTVALFSHVRGEAASPWEAVRGVYYQVLYGGGDITYLLGKGFWFPMTEWGFFKADGVQRFKGFLDLPSAGGWFLLSSMALAILASLGAHVALIVERGIGIARRGREAAAANPLGTLVLLNVPLLFLNLFLAHKPFYPHYSIGLFPLALVPVAWLLSRIGSRPALFGVALGLATAIGISQAVVCDRYYDREESTTSLTVMRETTRILVEDARGQTADLSCRIPGVRFGTYPVHILAEEVFGSKFREDGDARKQFTLTLPDHPLARKAVKVWEVGNVWLVKTEK